MSNTGNVSPESIPSLYAQQVVSGDHALHQHADNECCCVCSGQTFKEQMRLPGTRFGIHDCQSCGTGMLFPSPTPDELASFYVSQYYGESGQKFGRLTEILVRLVGNRQTHFLTRHLSPGGHVLDVGCGRGVVASPLAAAGYHVTGFEISADAVQGIHRDVEVLIAASLQEAPVRAAEYDLVIIWHVLEHVTGPDATLQAACRALKPGGKLVVAVPNYSSWQARLFGSAWFHLDPPRHLYHFPSTALQTLLKNCGLDVLREHHFSLRQNPFGWVQSILNKLLPRQRNRLYSYLLNEPLPEGNLTLAARIGWLATYVAGMVIVLPLAIAAAVFRSGGTIHYLAARPVTDQQTTAAESVLDG
ncbi:MAG: class I SAM-dependent methyltransferase [Fuerstiella sp.]|nr:class I SAM-dependent methyltransferase [Fuerstiella sp.]